MTPLLPRDFVADPAALEKTWSHAESVDYTRWLATHHYENFHVVSFLLPKHLHQDFYNVYAYCRWADDLGDETGGGDRALGLLTWWREELAGCYAGAPRHPVMVALAQTIRRFQIPREPFLDLVRAFEQDQHAKRYQTYAQVLDYCRYSANTVGRLVLYLCECFDDRKADRLSGAIRANLSPLAFLPV